MIDFWVYCKFLSTLSQSNKSKNKLTVTWSNWGRHSSSELYKGQIFGVTIDLNRQKKRKIKESRKQYEDIMDIMNMDEKNNTLKCIICDQYVDLDTNLQWLEWSKTYCFYCLINHIYLKKNWPNWKIELDRDRIRPNKELGKLIKILRSKIEIEKFPPCEEHGKEWMFHWEEWESFLWNIWMIPWVRKEHNVLDNESAFKYFTKEVVNRLHGGKSVFKKRRNAIDEIRYGELINQLIFDEAFKWIIVKMIHVKDEFKEERK